MELLPYLEQDALYKTFGTPLNVQTAGTNIGHRAAPTAYKCPTDPSYGSGLRQGDWANGSYAANFQVFGNPGGGGGWTSGGVGRRGTGI